MDQLDTYGCLPTVCFIGFYVYDKIPTLTFQWG
jgi:hypothetical protein